MNLRRELFGLLFAPVSVPLTFVLMRLLKAHKIGLGDDSDAFEGDMIFFGFIAYLVIGLVVIPLMIAFRRLRWANALSCAMIASVVWFILVFLLPRHYDFPIPDPGRLGLAISSSIAGALSGLVFWMIAHWKPGVAPE
jgi:hypothetical protein